MSREELSKIAEWYCSHEITNSMQNRREWGEYLEARKKEMNNDRRN